MPHIVSFLKGVALGAGALYLLDAENGAARRARLRRELMQLGVDLGDGADKAVVAAGHALTSQAEQAADWLVGAVTGKRPGSRNEPSALQAAAEEHLDSLWPSKSRLWAGTAGSALFFYGLANRRPLARLGAILGLGLLAEGLLHHSVSEAGPEPGRLRGQEPGTASPARSQLTDDASPSWKVAVP
ncbi:MAG TPA: hypothetical protein VHY20_03515 [Pirellulales bacterium]|jgi:hypothetical protein|nr:hypothetical protein [Pirellulales bacterium]